MAKSNTLVDRVRTELGEVQRAKPKHPHPDKQQTTNALKRRMRNVDQYSYENKFDAN